MKRATLIVLGLALLTPVHAAELDLSVTSMNDARRALRGLKLDGRFQEETRFQATAGRAAPATPVTLAIASAAKKGVVEDAVDGYTQVLIQCQKNRSVVLTTALLRSDAQQAHCSRF